MSYSAQSKSEFSSKNNFIIICINAALEIGALFSLNHIYLNHILLNMGILYLNARILCLKLLKRVSVFFNPTSFPTHVAPPVPRRPRGKWDRKQAIHLVISEIVLFCSPVLCTFNVLLSSVCIHILGCLMNTASCCPRLAITKIMEYPSSWGMILLFH